MSSAKKQPNFRIMTKGPIVGHIEGFPRFSPLLPASPRFFPASPRFSPLLPASSPGLFGQFRAGFQLGGALFGCVVSFLSVSNENYILFLKTMNF